MNDNTTQEKNKKDNKNNSLVSSVVIALAIIFVGFLMIKSGASPTDKKLSGDSGSTLNSLEKKDSQRPVNEDDHIRGNIDAPIKIVEYSDTECPFCKNFHFTMRQIINEYNGQVAWVYRHFPIDSLHPKARKEAEATECADELGGNEMFWVYLDRLFEVTPSNNQLDPAKLGEIAESVGLDADDFESCLDSGKYANKISRDIEDGITAGVTGTPHSVLITSDGKKTEIRGAQPYEAVKAMIKGVLE